MKNLFVACLTLLVSATCIAQKPQYKVAVISFYNLENFYDTVRNPAIDDREFLPTGDKNYNSSIYWDKVKRLATVISQIGTEMSPDGPAILGVAEIENDTVLTDLVNHPLIKQRNYKIVHYDSKDARGVDVGMLYNPKYFTVEVSAPLYVQLPGGSKDAWHTRDVLWVKGKLDGETVHIYVNHWPSRRGGEERSQPARNAAAAVVKAHIDGVMAKTPDAKVVVMGDLNDDPTSPSVAQILKAKGKEKEVRTSGLFNPWVDLYKKGIGTLAYQDAWGLFDQIIVSHAWLSKEQEGFFYFMPKVFNKEYMVENIGRYKGYPMRTWDGNTYRAGYSDHFPTYLIMLKKVKQQDAIAR
ncbi:endonuclease/exonuclease/phosphatase family protein [Aridibaculum aurantiacum]|uniref:endonuclease/exonuclease/phosphatase family protein n=1 Tax=Aridibaculum aurantiacum TaxID=2810307 RepID=UPI001A95BB3B|nr:endonuclease/exonuclease/phosphatase family protein [Aridibaculum aurantiacum]